MKLYSLTYKEAVHALNGTDDNGYQYTPKVVERTEWFTSERNAVIRRLELYKLRKLEGKKKDAKIWGVEVPIRKDALVAWLNNYERERG